MKWLLSLLLFFLLPADSKADVPSPWAKRNWRALAKSIISDTDGGFSSE
jgi:hypothetical protein